MSHLRTLNLIQSPAKAFIFKKILKDINMNIQTFSPETHSINLQKPITIRLTDRLSVRLYCDSRPHCMETASLQKGLVLMFDNQELIDEGLGFGVPVAKYGDKTYFSGSAEVAIQKNPSAVTLKKTYILDTISRKKIWRASYINDGFYSSARKSFAKLYLTRKNLSPLFNTIMELREKAKIKTEFIKVKPRGVITVNYEIEPLAVKVSVDFSRLTLKGCEEVLVLNEQGSTTFEKYADTSGLKLFGREIGAWDAITADQASMLMRPGPTCIYCSKHPWSYAVQRLGENKEPIFVDRIKLLITSKSRGIRLYN